MKINRFHRWLLALILALQMGWVALPACLAADGVTIPDTATSDQGFNTTEVPADTSTDLSKGGAGISIQPGEATLSTAISQKSLAETVIGIVNYFIGFLGLVATIFIIYAGVLMIVSAGNEEAVTKGRKILTYSAVGFVVIILSYSIVNFIAGAGNSATGTPVASTEHCPPSDATAPLCKTNEVCGVDTAGKPACLPNTTTAIACHQDADCPQGQVCGASLICKRNEAGAANSTTTTPAVKSNTDKADSLMDGLADELNPGTLASDDQKKLDEALSGGTLDEKIENLKKLRDDKNTSANFLGILDRLIDGLERLKDLRVEIDKLKDNMPQSKDILAAYDNTSKELDKLIDTPTDAVQYRRYETSYRTLKALILKFPMVQAHIHAFPGEGNVPFTVQIDGLDSFDPTGGTISDYRWSLTDPSGNDISLGNQPVIIHDFTEANTYAVKLQVSTSQKDSEGYKTAMDGVSVLRIKANPPVSKVQFRINGIDAFDVAHQTLLEAQSGLSFDPSPTTPALGHTIVKYDWSFGDSTGESRLAPTTVVHSYGKPGQYYVKLEVTDNLGIKDKRIVTLLVKSLAADMRINPATGNVNTDFTFGGERSRSDDGFIKGYSWEIQDAKGARVAQSQDQTFSNKFEAPGNYKVNLVVTDLTGTTDKLTKDLVVMSRPPVAAFMTSVPQNNHPSRIEFNAIDSYDPDPGDSITYSWDFNGDGTFEIADSKDSVATYEYQHKGDFKVTLQVTDSFGLHKSLEKKITVDSVLSADLKADRFSARVGDEVKFSAENSNAVAYVWEFGDGETLNTDKTSVTHTYAKSGKFMVKMNFFDKGDEENFATQRIIVGSGEKPMAVIGFTVNGVEPPIIDGLCGKDKSGVTVTRADLIRFDARNSLNTDGTGRLMDYNWKFPDGKRITTRDATYKFSDISQQDSCFTVSLVARDQISGKISDEDQFYFKVINQLPQITDFVISAPNAEALITPVKISLRAINPKDFDGTIKKYRWYYYREGFETEKLGLHNTSAPETVMVITSSGEPDVTNRYYFVLEIFDNDNGEYTTKDRFGEVSYLDIKNGPNLSPVAEFTTDKSTITVGDSITFVSKSYDPQGDPLPNDAFRWDFDGDGQFDVTSGSQVNRIYNTPGEFDVRLKVIYRGLSSSTDHKIVVEPSNALPQAAFTYAIEGNTVHFDASTSRFDPSLKDPAIRFEWDFDTAVDSNGNGILDDDVQSSEQKPSFTYDQKGVYGVKLTVIDSLGMKGVVVRKVNLTQTEVERQKSSYHSLKITAPQNPITTLDLQVTPSTFQKGGSADVEVTVLNADSSPYAGKVYFDILEGAGQFTPNPVDAKDSKAAAVFSATEAGTVRIRVRATGTIYGDLTEDATINVK